MVTLIVHQIFQNANIFSYNHFIKLLFLLLLIVLLILLFFILLIILLLLILLLLILYSPDTKQMACDSQLLATTRVYM